MSNPRTNLYDNKSEDGFATVRSKRNRVLAANATVVVAIVVLFWFVFGIPAISTGSQTDLELWLAATAFPALLLVGQLGIQLSRPLDIRVERDAIWVTGRRRVPVTRILGCAVVETSSAIAVRRPAPQSNRFWFMIQKSNLADWMRFKASLEEVLGVKGKGPAL